MSRELCGVTGRCAASEDCTPPTGDYFRNFRASRYIDRRSGTRREKLLGIFWYLREVSPRRGGVARFCLIAASDPLVNVCRLLEHETWRTPFSFIGIQQTLPPLLAICPRSFFFFHRVVSQMKLDTQYPWIRNALEGVARGHPDVGTQQRLHLPVSWAVLRAGASFVTHWG